MRHQNTLHYVRQAPLRVLLCGGTAVVDPHLAGSRVDIEISCDLLYGAAQAVSKELLSEPGKPAERSNNQA